MVPFIIYDFKQISLHNFTIPEVYFNLLFLGIMGSCFCFVMWNKAVAAIGAVKASSYIYLVPIFTAGSSILFLNEKLSIPLILGGILILFGVFLSAKGFKIFKFNKKQKCSETLCCKC